MSRRQRRRAEKVCVLTVFPPVRGRGGISAGCPLGAVAKQNRRGEAPIAQLRAVSRSKGGRLKHDPGVAAPACDTTRVHTLWA